MSVKTVHHDDDEVARRINPALASFVATGAEFRAAVRVGIASYEAGPTHDLAAVEAELQDLIHGEG